MCGTFTRDAITVVVFIGARNVHHSEQLEMRIALLEQKYPQEREYITMLKGQLKMYLDNPVLDRETESQMIHRLVKAAKERNG